METGPAFVKSIVWANCRHAGRIIRDLSEKPNIFPTLVRIAERLQPAKSLAFTLHTMNINGLKMKCDER
jgi:hypothetical protein